MIQIAFLRIERETLDAGIILTADFTVDKAMDKNTWEKQVEEDLCAAVTLWIKETEEGKKLWEYSVEDLNIGDLCDYLEEAYSDPVNSTLRPYLDRFQFSRIECHGLTGSEILPYDTILVNQSDLEGAD